MASEVELIAERAVTMASEQWPSAQEVVLCLDCDALFRRGRACLFCGSESVLNLAAVINRQIAN